ncbi:MAG: hypothetical protein KDA86_12380 [Planctomycetaceae bacterium]|nr:hypothetical protein [Planctomycetaceae bacterium]
MDVGKPLNCSTSIDSTGEQRARSSIDFLPQVASGQIRIRYKSVATKRLLEGVPELFADVQRKSLEDGVDAEQERYEQTGHPKMAVWRV